MRVLVTGAAGRIGRRVVDALREDACEVRTLDRRACSDGDHWPGSVLDGARIRQAIQGCDAIVHLAAIPNDRSGLEDDVFSTNVQGTWHVLQGAAEAGVSRVIHFSSIQAVGLTSTERKPDYLPLDDAHPRYPARPYALSKGMGEDLCRYFSETTGMVAISLRPTYVTDADTYSWWQPAEGPHRSRWHRYAASDLWSYCDVDDVVEAVRLSLRAEGIRHGSFLLAADDTTSATPTADILAEYYPDVPLRLPEGALDARPFHGLVDTSAAARALGWRPRRSWREVVGV